MSRYDRLHADDAQVTVSGNVAVVDFTQKKRLMQSGMEAGQQAATAIHQALDAWSVKHAQLNAAR